MNTIIRRMIIMELNRHRKREQTMLKRAHSDTESLLARKRHNDGRRYRLLLVLFFWISVGYCMVTRLQKSFREYFRNEWFEEVDESIQTVIVRVSMIVSMKFEIDLKMYLKYIC